MSYKSAAYAVGVITALIKGGVPGAVKRVLRGSHLCLNADDVQVDLPSGITVNPDKTIVLINSKIHQSSGSANITAVFPAVLMGVTSTSFTCSAAYNLRGGSVYGDDISWQLIEFY